MELFEQDLAQLLGRAEVKDLTGEVVRLCFQGLQTPAQLAALLPQALLVEQRADALHTREHGRQWQFYLLEHRAQPGLGLEPGPQGLVQRQGHLRILGRVGRGLADPHLIEADLLGALAGDLLEMRGAPAQIFQGQRVHVVPGARGVEHVGLEHGVEGDTAQRDAVTGQHAGIVFQVLTDLGAGRVFEQRLERGEAGVAIELDRRPGIAVRQGQVSGAVGRHREGHPDHFGAHVIEARGLRIEGEQLGLFQSAQPALEAGLIEHRVVSLGRVAAALTLGGLVLGSLVLGGMAVARRLVASGFQLDHPAFELQLAKQAQQRGLVRRAVGQIAKPLGERKLGRYGGQSVRQIGAVFVFLQARGQGFGAANTQGLHPVEVGVDRIQPAEAAQQGQGGLFPHARHAGDVIDFVAHKGQQIDDPLRRNTEFILHPLAVQHRVGHGVDQRDPLAHKLGHVLVAGGDDHRRTRLAGLAGQGADNIIGLNPGLAEQGQAHGAHDAVNRLYLLTQLVRHGRAVGLVLGIPLIAEGFALGVEHHGDGAGGVILAQPAQHVNDALDRPGCRAAGGAQRWQRVVGPVQIRGTVYQDQGRGFRHGHCSPKRGYYAARRRSGRPSKGQCSHR